MTLREIETAVSRLSFEEFAQFRAWFEAHEDERRAARGDEETAEFELAELERRWEGAKDAPAAAHKDVERWLRTWGSPNFRPWRAP